MTTRSLRSIGAVATLVGLAWLPTATSRVVAGTPDEPPGTAVTGPPLVISGVDWGNLTYDVACGAADRIEIVDGRYAPASHNSDVERLEATIVGADEVPSRAGYVLVRMTCVAGGPTAALSQNAYLVMDVDGQAATDPSPPPASDPALPTVAAIVIAEPDSTHVMNDDGVIVVDDTTFGANDPNCCPSVFRSQQVVWDESGLPVVVEGARPDTSATTSVSAGSECVATELDAETADPAQALALEASLAAAGFDPGPVDGVLDQTAMNAVVRFIEFNAGNPALHDDDPNRPYDNLHAEASQHGVVRRPVLTALGIACETVTTLPRS